MHGPAVQEDLFTILLRFRKHQYVLTADIEKMFRQIAVATEDQDLKLSETHSGGKNLHYSKKYYVLDIINK